MSAERSLNVGTEGQPVPTPDYLTASDVDATRASIINCALWDVRETEPHATPYRVAQWVDAYLTHWESLSRSVAGDPR